MTQKELNYVKTLFLAKELYNKLEEAYKLEGSRGFRPDIRDRVEKYYDKFNTNNEKLEKEDKINSAITLKLTA